MKKSLFQLGIAVAVLIAFTITYALWYGAVAKKSASVALLQSQIDTQSETASRISSARAALTEIAGDEAAVRSYFVPESGVVGFINDLEARAKLQGAKVSVRSVGATGKDDNAGLEITLTISGTFSAVMRTIGTIEYSPYALTTTSLAVGGNSEDGWQADMHAIVGSTSATAKTTTP